MSRQTAMRLTIAFWLVMLCAVLAGVGLQSRWDAQCERATPGTRWNADVWACEDIR